MKMKLLGLLFVGILMLGLSGCVLSPEIRAAYVKAKVAELKAQEEYFNLQGDSYTTGTLGTVEQRISPAAPARRFKGVLLNPSSRPVTVVIRAVEAKVSYSAVLTVDQRANGLDGRVDVQLPQGRYWVEVWPVGLERASATGYCRVDGKTGDVILSAQEVVDFAWFLR